MRVKVLFLTTGLNLGGAERMLAKLLSRLHGRSIDAGVVSLLSPGVVSAEIEHLGVPVWHLGIEAPHRLLAAIGKLLAIGRCFRPDVIQGWMYHGNLAAHWMRSAVARDAKLILGIRQSLYDMGREKFLTRRVISLGSHLSHRADAIVYNSETARAQHETFGYAAARARVIDNGFAPEIFCPDPAAYQALRCELGLPHDVPIIGLIARFHHLKGHDVFLDAATRLAERRPDVHFLLAGWGINADNPSFAPYLARQSLARRFHFLGERIDVPRLMAALDIATSASSGEGFPNVIGEAMSCAVPCVVTDFGDSRRIVGDRAGLVVQVGDVESLVHAWQMILDLPDDQRLAMGVAGRQRVLERFSLEHVADQYAELYNQVRLNS